MKIHKISPEEYIEMPWKNGKGISFEIFRFPKNATDWNFRVSLANVSSSGEFSLFPGFNRAIMLLSGNGMNIESRNINIKIDKINQLHFFSGDEHINAHLIDGKNVDFNFIWDRTKFETEIIFNEKPKKYRLEADWVILFNIITHETTIITNANSQDFYESHSPSISIFVRKK